jgi:hypothetical protein
VQWNEESLDDLETDGSGQADGFTETAFGVAIER